MSSRVLQRLRGDTHGLHRETERALDLARASSSLAEYAALLERLRAFYEPLEERLFALPNARLRLHADLELRRKSPALRADLHFLRPHLAVRAEHCAYLPPITADLDAAGAWYMVEGATLGGRVIAEHLARRLGLAVDTGARFFHSYGEDRQQRWDEFCRFLASIPDADAGRVASAAVESFRAMRRWLAERPDSSAEGAR